MKQLLIILGLSLLASCGSNDHLKIDNSNLPNQNVNVHIDLKPEVAEFEFQMDVKINFPVLLVERLRDYRLQTTANQRIPSLPESVDAVCWTASNGDKLVEVKRSRWEALSDGGKEQLMFHELGHCALNKEHNAKMRTDKTFCKASIMNPWTFSEDDIKECYNPDREYYLDELAK